MPSILHHRGLLQNFYNDPRHSAWAKDLICRAIASNGFYTDTDIELILDELITNVAIPSQPMPISTTPFPTIELLRLKHVAGVNALAQDQEIHFCNEGITLFFGYNGSGKSGYFRILNQLTGGSINYPLLCNVFDIAPPSVNIELDYNINGVTEFLLWDGVSICPTELKHCRLYDARYAANMLEPHDGNTYLFQNYNLAVFRSINKMLDEVKSFENSLGNTEIELRNLCSTSYCNLLVTSLIQRFNDELSNLGMEHLQINLVVNDLLTPYSQIKIQIQHQDNIHQILSEAELKCASLALFLAECDMLDVNVPLIFDDPVNSLDSHILEAFVKRVVTLPNQVILFTHDTQLMSLMIEQAEIHRNIKLYNNHTVIRNSSKKHMLAYEVISDRPMGHGYILDYSSKKYNYYLEKADRILTTPPLTNAQEVVDILRHAVESMVDEV